MKAEKKNTTNEAKIRHSPNTGAFAVRFPDIAAAGEGFFGILLLPGRRPVGASPGLVLCGGFGWALRGGGRRLCPPFPIGSVPPGLGYRLRGGGEAFGRSGGRSAVAASGEAGA